MSLKNRRERRKNRRYDGDSSDVRYTGYGSGNTRTFGKRRRGRIAGPIIIACAIVAVLVAADYLVNSGRVYRGVEVGNVSLGSKTADEARRIVEDRIVGDLKEVEFRGPKSEPVSFTAEQMGVNFEIQSTVDEAYAVGREGNVLERLTDRGGALIGGITIPPEVRYEPGKAQARVERLANRVNTDPTDANLEIQGSVAEVLESREGYRLDVAATTRAVGAAVDDMTGEVRMAGKVLEPKVTTQEAERAAERAQAAMSGEIVLTAEGNRWTLSPTSVGDTLDITRENGAIQVSLNKDRMNDALAGVYGDIEVEPKEASYEFANDGSVIVTESQTGQSIEYDKLLETIQSNIFEGQREYEIPVTTSKPQYTTAELQAQKPTELLGTYKTNYEATTDQGAARVENLKTASKAVSGTFVAPGDTFSMLDYITDLDYNTAHVIVEDKEEMAEGGGLCQVTSTLYNAALFAGLEVVERWPHNSQLPYIRPGMDATVWYGDTTTEADDLDMKFKNTTDGYVLVQEYVDDDGYIYANVYGVPDNVEVQMSSRPVWMTQDASQWITHYTRTKNGEVVYKDSWKSDYDALYDTEGKKINTKIVPIAEVDGTYLGPEF